MRDISSILLVRCQQEPIREHAIQADHYAVGAGAACLRQDFAESSGVASRQYCTTHASAKTVWLLTRQAATSSSGWSGDGRR